MIRAPQDHSAFELEPFFAAERELAAEPEELRRRVMERAWASLQRQPALPYLEREGGPRRVRVGLAAAAVVLLSGMCALAFYAGYRANHRGPDTANRATVAASTTLQQWPAPSLVVALVPVPVASSHVAATSPEHNAPVPRGDKVAPAASGKTTLDIEAYTKELRVLQPARQAVARGEYGAALASIADHQNQYPSGKLAEEREALRVKALLGLGRTAEAQRAGAAFRARFPRSALTKRIDTLLGTEP